MVAFATASLPEATKMRVLCLNNQLELQLQYFKANELSNSGLKEIK